ncbi:MAG: hypothetical protein HOQ24_04120, partial [Mycobacteriaceae bacterium]|nr:hypothetical protein [Mycobacteriaceae bacterium]
MAAPTKTQVMSWTAGALGLIATDAGKIRDAIDAQADTMHRTIHGLEWSGKAYNAATGRADREKSQQRAVATGYDNLSTAAQSAENDTGWAILQIQQTIRSLPHGWTVADDFTVTGATDADKNLAANDTTNLKNLAIHIGQAMDTWGKKITDAITEISTMAPVSAQLCYRNPLADLTPEQGKADLQAVRDGIADAATLSRIRMATDLSAQDQAALANGKQVNLPQFGYLQGFTHGMDGMSAQDIANLGNNLPGDGHNQVQAAVANDFRILSNPAVHSAGLDGVPDGKSVGGIKQLPDHVQTLLTQNPIRIGVGANGKPTGMLTIKDATEMQSLADVMSKGDKTIQGSDVNRAMIKQGA